MTDTAGLKWAPLNGPSSAIRVASTATVAPVLARSATPVLPPLRRSAMIPDPTTVAANSADPRPSTSARRESGLLCIVGAGIRCTTNRVQALLEPHPVDRGERSQQCIGAIYFKPDEPGWRAIGADEEEGFQMLIRDIRDRQLLRLKQRHRRRSGRSCTDHEQLGHGPLCDFGRPFRGLRRNGRRAALSTAVAAAVLG